MSVDRRSTLLTWLALGTMGLAGPGSLAAQEAEGLPGTAAGVLQRVSAPDLRASFSLRDILSAGFAYELVAAGEVDRIAWIVNERGRRNVYTAGPPDFRPVRLTRHEEDDGVDMTDLQISDDGSVVTFIRGHTPNRDGWIANPGRDPDGGRREIWAARTGGGEPWRVTSALDAALSPDGKWVVHERDGQLHRAAVDPRDPDTPSDDAPLFRAFGHNGDPTWSPDGRKVAFVSDRETHSFIGVYDVETREIAYLAPGVDRDSAPVWSPDGRRIAFVRRPGLPFGARAGRGADSSRAELPDGLTTARFQGGHGLSIRVADVETQEGREIWHDPAGDSRFQDIRRLLWGEGHLTFESEPGNWRHWFSIALEDPSPEPIHLTPGEGFVEEADLSPDGRWLYYSANVGDIDRRSLWRVPVRGGAPERLTGGDGIETFPAVLGSGQRVAFLSASHRQPQSVALMAATGGDLRVIGPDLPARFPLDQHVVPENVVLTADDGVTFHNQLFLPPDLGPGERRPALIFIHGGPSRQMLLGYHYGHFYHMAYAVNQYFANRGYVVLSVNYRRGIGYGKTFRTAPNTREQGMEEYQDVRAAGLYLRDRDDVDAGKIALWGLSYGGTLTAQGLARDSDLFAAGVDIAGVHYFVDPRFDLPEALDPTSVAYRSSSAPRVDDWRSPVLLVHGDDDRNVPFFQTVGLVQALRAHGVPHELIVFPDDVHAFLVHDRWIRTFEAMDDFLDRVMIRGEATRVRR